MKNQADYSQYKCPFSHVEKECRHELKGPEGYQDTYGVWCACGFRGPVFCLDPVELGLEKRVEHMTEKLKTSELEGKALDYAVALAIDIKLFNANSDDWPGNSKICEIARDEAIIVIGLNWGITKEYCGRAWVFEPSRDWKECGPLIEEYKLTIEHDQHIEYPANAYIDGADMNIFFGRSIPEAAMRALVAYKLGNEVEIPKELCQN